MGFIWRGGGGSFLVCLLTAMVTEFTGITYYDREEMMTVVS
jgi:hypothetical protein